MRAIAALVALVSIAGCRTRLLGYSQSFDLGADAASQLPSCENGVRDRNESDVDCGGCCSACQNGRHCGESRDCSSGVCTGEKCLAPTCQGCTLRFSGGRPQPTGGAFVVGDFDGDQISDIVGTANHQANATIVVMLGIGDGSFHQITLDNSGVVPRVAVDLNRDGRLDLVVSGSRKTTDIDSGEFHFNSEMDVLLGQGDGTFAAPIAIPDRGEVIAMVSGDWNGDGKPDLASVEQSPVETRHTILLRMGVGDGTFTQAIAVDLGDAVTALATGDWNGDCQTDLAVALASSRVGILVNRGGGGFEIGTTQPVRAGPWSLAVGDFDNDRKLDLIVGDNRIGPSIAQLDLLIGNGDGTLNAARSFGGGFQTTSVACADLNGDGNLDVVVGTTPANGTSPDFPLWILLGDGRGAFAEPVSLGLYLGISQVAVADFNRDGKADVAFTGNLILNTTH